MILSVGYCSETNSTNTCEELRNGNDTIFLFGILPNQNIILVDHKEGKVFEQNIYDLKRNRHTGKMFFKLTNNLETSFTKSINLLSKFPSISGADFSINDIAKVPYAFIIKLNEAFYLSWKNITNNFNFFAIDPNNKDQYKVLSLTDFGNNVNKMPNFLSNSEDYSYGFHTVNANEICIVKILKTIVNNGQFK